MSLVTFVKFDSWLFPYIGMPMVTRCHWQCRDRLSQIFGTLCKVCFYGWFSIENEVNAGNLLPGLIHWVLLLMQFWCFRKKIEYFEKYVSLKFCLLSKTHFQQNCIHGSDIEWKTNLWSWSLHWNTARNWACSVAFKGKTKPSFGWLKWYLPCLPLVADSVVWLRSHFNKCRFWCSCLLWWLLGIFVYSWSLNDQKLWYL